MKTKIALILIVISLSFIGCNNKHFEQLEKTQKETLLKVEVLQVLDSTNLVQINLLTERISALEAKNNKLVLEISTTEMAKVNQDISSLKLMQNEYAEDIKRLHDWHWWWVEHWGVDYRKIN